MAAAARRDDLAALIAAAEEHGVHPRSLFAAPLIYRTLLPLAAEGAANGASPCQVVLDFGHARAAARALAAIATPSTDVPAERRREVAASLNLAERDIYDGDHVTRDIIELREPDTYRTVKSLCGSPA